MIGARQLVIPGAGEDWGAIWSPCKTWRYRLWRRWSTEQHLTALCLNPSIASETINDPTVARLMNRARREGYGGLEVLNLYAIVSTDPAGLLAHPDPVGPDNDAHVVEAARTTGRLVLGFGDQRPRLGRAFDERVAALYRLLRGRPVFALHVTKKRGLPGHPLYLSSSCDIRPYDWPAWAAI